MATTSIPVDKFAHILSKERDWYQVGTHLGVPVETLDSIEDRYGSKGVFRCLVEVHKWFKRTDGTKKTLCWERVCDVLRDMGNNTLADAIYTKCIVSSSDHRLSRSDHNPSSRRRRRDFSPYEPRPQHWQYHSHYNRRQSRQLHRSSSTPPTYNRLSQLPSPEGVIVNHDSVDSIAKKYTSLSNKFILMLNRIKGSFQDMAASRNEGSINLGQIQDLLKRYYGLERLLEKEATVDIIFDRLEEHCSMLNISVLLYIIEHLLKDQELLQSMMEFEESVKEFKSCSNMVELVHLISCEQPKTVTVNNYKLVKLKVHEFWCDFTMKQFEIMMNEIFSTLYEFIHQVSVTKGCICISWTIPHDVNYAELMPSLHLDLVKSIGVISLEIGDDLIYNVVEEGLGTIEGAMLQAIKLRNTRAVELLLAVGGRPEVTTENTVTTIINIKESPSSGNSKPRPPHTTTPVCVLGHNEHVEAIVDPSSEQRCTSCVVKEKLNMNLCQEMGALYQKLKSFEAQADIEGSTEEYLMEQTFSGEPTDFDNVQKLNEELKKKDKEILLLKSTNEQLLADIRRKDIMECLAGNVDPKDLSPLEDMYTSTQSPTHTPIHTGIWHTSSVCTTLGVTRTASNDGVYACADKPISLSSSVIQPPTSPTICDDEKSSVTNSSINLDKINDGKFGKFVDELIETTFPSPDKAPPSEHSDSDELPSIDFLTVQISTDTTNQYHLFEVMVPSNVTPDQAYLGHKALEHSWTVYTNYLDALSAHNVNQTLVDLMVADGRIAILCPMNLYLEPRPRLCSQMPKECIPFKDWDMGIHSVLHRHSLLQQIINTLAVLFKFGTNNLSFWGSTEVWINNYRRVYLYLDLIKALKIQKEHVSQSPLPDARIEDCKMLKKMYTVILKQYFLLHSIHMSPQLREVYDTFESILENVDNCISTNLVSAAHVFGNRQLCQLNVLLESDHTPFIYYIYCLKHENLSTVLEAILKPLLPHMSWTTSWTVYYSDSISSSAQPLLPVCVTDVVDPPKHGHEPYIGIKIIPHPATDSTMHHPAIVPGAYHLKQSCNELD